MAVLSNNGRLIVSLPVASTLQSTDQFIIQSVSNTNPNGVTKRATYGFLLSDLNSLILTNIQNTPTLKFSGSFYNPNGGIANFDTTRVRSGLTVTTGGITVSSGASTFQSVTATQFNGPLTGNVTGNITSTGTSNFSTIIVANTIAGNINSSGLSTFANLQMAGGIIGGLPGAITINNTPIGNTNPSTIKGTSITGSLGIKSLLGLHVDSFAKITGTLYANGGLIGNKISASLGITGSIKGNLTGDIFSPTGIKVLENGTGISKKSLFFGTSSYASSSFRAITASYAFASIAANKVNLSNSSSYASSSISSSYTTKARFSFSSSYASSSFRSKFSFSSSYASSSKKSNSSLYASSSKTSLTSSYVLQTNSSYTNKLAYYDGTSINIVNDFKVDDTGNYRFLYFSGSSNLNNPLGSIGPNKYVVIDGYKPPGGSDVLGQSALALSLDINRSLRNPPNGYLPFAYNYGPEAWNILVYQSGSFTIQTYKQSYAFSSSNYYIKTNNSPIFEATFNPIKIINNSIYFWGDPKSYNTSMRDGALGIGVTSHNIATGQSALEARLHIEVFSASYADLGKGGWNGTAPVRNLPAILVRYGSGSISSPTQKTFYVSGSGETYIGGTLSSSKNVYVGGNLHVSGQIKGDASSGYAKAWVNFGFDGINTIVSSSYNVSGVNRNGSQGDYTITFSTPFSNNNYLMIGTSTIGNASYPAAAGIAYKMSSNNTLATKTTSAVRIAIFDNSTDAMYDPKQANIVFFGGN